nr:uncharacterized protein LOC121502542 [Drosophila kikkawai]
MEICPVSEQEILVSARTLKNKKAPGPDSIPNRATKLLLTLHAKAIADLFNKCLAEGSFPVRWKRQKLLLPETGKPAGEASSYRPICLLDTIGKVFEKMIVLRLEAAIERAGAKEYCLVVTLDIRNAFNSADWRRTLEALEAFSIPGYLLRIVRSYLSERSLIVDTSQGTRTHEVSAGVPQGSVLGPLLWNTMYNGVLNLPLSSNTTIVGFADDVALVVVAKELADAEMAANSAIRAVESWLAVAGLELASHKTEAVLISSREASGNGGDPAPAWAEAVKVRSYVRGVEGVYRLCALRVACAFRTVSDDAALVIAGQVPICELVREAQEARLSREPGNSSARREARSSARSSSIARWQSRWDSSTKGRWTHRLIPDIQSWITRKHGEVDFYLTQALRPLPGMRDRCRRERAIHVLFECHRFHHERLALEEVVGAAIGADNLVPTMLGSQKAWDATATFVASVMKTLRTLETERRMRAESGCSKWQELRNAFQETDAVIVNQEGFAESSYAVKNFQSEFEERYMDAYCAIAEDLDKLGSETPKLQPLPNGAADPKVRLNMPQMSVPKFSGCKKDDTDSIRSMLSTVNVCLAAFRPVQALGGERQHWLAHYIASKLP